MISLNSSFKISSPSDIDAHRKLLTPPTAPSDQRAPVGLATATLEDLQQIMPVCQILMS